MFKRILVSTLLVLTLLINNTSAYAVETFQDDSVEYVCKSVKDAGNILRTALKERRHTVTIEVPNVKDINDTFYAIYDRATKHTGAPDEGDYLSWNTAKITSKTYYGKSKTDVIYVMSITYRTDSYMETEISKAITELKPMLAIKKSMSDYEKLKVIYDYLTYNIEYDELQEFDSTYTAYSALIEGEAVCQGYALLLYRLLLEYGIDNRVIVSTDHAWNLVCIDGLYYECDATWDSVRVHEGKGFKYFLQADLHAGYDTTHVWSISELDSEILTLPRAKYDYGSNKLQSPKLAGKKKNNTVVLNWSNVPNADTYVVEVKTAKGDWTVVKRVSGENAKLKKTNQKKQLYRVCARTAKGKSPYSNIISIK